MRVAVVPGFATTEEIKALNDWAEFGVQNKWLDCGVTADIHTAKQRVTSRFYSDRYQYPQFVRDVSTRVREFVGVGAYPLIEGQGRDGVVVSYISAKGDVFRHKDSKSKEGLATLRCNILTQEPTAGGVLFVEGQQVDVKVGDLHCYLVSEHEHWVTEVEGNTPRIMWMFGAHVPAGDWDSEKIKVQK